MKVASNLVVCTRLHPPPSLSEQVSRVHGRWVRYSLLLPVSFGLVCSSSRTSGGPARAPAATTAPCSFLWSRPHWRACLLGRRPSPACVDGVGCPSSLAGSSQ